MLTLPDCKSSLEWHYKPTPTNSLENCTLENITYSVIWHSIISIFTLHEVYQQLKRFCGNVCHHKRLKLLLLRMRLVHTCGPAVMEGHEQDQESNGSSANGDTEVGMEPLVGVSLDSVVQKAADLSFILQTCKHSLEEKPTPSTWGRANSWSPSTNYR